MGDNLNVINVVGVPLSNGGASEECEALPETAAAEHPDHYGAHVAWRRWWQQMLIYIINLECVCNIERKKCLKSFKYIWISWNDIEGKVAASGNSQIMIWILVFSIPHCCWVWPMS